MPKTESDATSLIGKGKENMDGNGKGKEPGKIILVWNYLTDEFDEMIEYNDKAKNTAINSASNPNNNKRSNLDYMQSERPKVAKLDSRYYIDWSPKPIPSSLYILPATENLLEIQTPLLPTKTPTLMTTSLRL